MTLVSIVAPCHNEKDAIEKRLVSTFNAVECMISNKKRKDWLRHFSIQHCRSRKYSLYEHVHKDISMIFHVTQCIHM